MDIRRYLPMTLDDTYQGMLAREDGDWVRFTDHERVVRALQAKLKELEDKDQRPGSPSA